MVIGATARSAFYWGRGKWWKTKEKKWLVYKSRSIGINEVCRGEAIFNHETICVLARKAVRSHRLETGTPSLPLLQQRATANGAKGAKRSGDGN